MCGPDCGCLDCLRSRGLVTSAIFTVTAADTEYSMSLPSNVLGLSVSNLSRAGLRFAFVSGVVADPTATPMDNFELSPGERDRDMGEMMLGSGMTLYYASTLSGARFVIEFLLGTV